MLKVSEPMARRDAQMLSPLQLAYMGDTVWDLLVRTELLHSGRNVRGMHREAITRVNAGAQAVALGRIAGFLTEEEAELVKRGRNTHAHHGAPKNQDPAAYSQATGLETLLGYLYLTGQDDRLRELFRLTQEEAV